MIEVCCFCGCESESYGWACDCNEEPACAQCGAPTEQQCECSGYQAEADSDESLGLTDRKSAPF